MRMNGSMRRLLNSSNLSLPRALDEILPGQLPEMVTIDGSVLLADRYEHSRSVSLKQFPDRTGYECLVNHSHFPYDGSPGALCKVMARIAGIRRSLVEYAPDRSFLILVSITEAECTIRFHECRAGERWLADDLEGYEEEAIAAIGVGPATDC